MQESPAREYLRLDIRPPDPNEVDWETAPLPYKLYKGAAQIRLSYASDNQLDKHAGKPLMPEQIGQMLADIYGITRLGRISKSLKNLLSASKQVKGKTGFHSSFLRPVPSGGALFPCEVYLLVGLGQTLPTGIYHYDVVHHALDVLRQGNYTDILAACLAHSGTPPAAYTLLLSCFFGKDSFKYGAFSYRLQGFDIGAVIAQSDLMACHYGLQGTTHYQFVDSAINQLLGLDHLHESVYAIMTLHNRQIATIADTTMSSGYAANNMQDEQPLTVSLPQAEQLASIAHWPLLKALHQASQQTQRDFRHLHSLPALKRLVGVTRQTLSLPSSPLDLLEGRRARRSAQDVFFKPEPLTPQQLIHLLMAAIAGYTNDLDGQTTTLQHTLLYCLINQVEDIPAGVYCFDPETHTLECFRAEDGQAMMQEWLRNNRQNVSLYLFPVGNYEAGLQIYGDRWYRMQNMEAGMMLQRLYLAAATLGLGCRAKFNFPEQKTDQLLGLPQGYTSLIHAMISPERTGYQYYEQPLLHETCTRLER